MGGTGIFSKYTVIFSKTKFTWAKNPARRGVPGPYIEPFPRPVERDEPFPGAEAWWIMTARQHEMYRYFAERREGFSDAVPA